MIKPVAPGLATAVLQALPQPVIVCAEDHRIMFVNYAAEAFFGASLSVLSRQRLDDLIAFGSPIIGLVVSVRRASATRPMTGLWTSSLRRSRETRPSRCCSRSAPWPTRSTASW
jgi:two-component system, NtrC family, nitrogen regulation sensor histidine kinase GlnL